jgi:methyl-accepting chemotaxis protein
MFDRLLSPVIGDEETIVKARALNLLALVTALLVVVYAFVLLVSAPGQLTAGALVALAIALVLGLGCYWLGRQGRVRLAAYVLFIGLFVAISFYMTEPLNTISDLTMAPFLYILVVLPAGYILHPRASFITATLAAIYTVGFVLIAQPAAYLAFEHKASFWSNIGLAFALFYILSAIAWVFSEGVNRALAQARQQNRELVRITQEVEDKRALQTDSGQQILALAEQLSEYSSRQARGSNRQAAAVAQVSTTIEELKQAAQEIAQNAGLVDQAAQETLHRAQEGQDAVWMNNEAMAIIYSNAQKGAEEANALDEHLKQVSRVATVINNVASQIQLVAFNATLEAAEAGEAGQRFSVVASGVKDLAADSLKQSKQVAEAIRQVQDTGETVVTLSDEQMQAVQTGSSTMSRSNSANQAIMESAAKMASQAAQIQKSTAQQQQASEQVAASIHEIKTVADRWVVSSYQMDELVDSLRSLAAHLA